MMRATESASFDTADKTIHSNHYEIPGGRPRFRTPSSDREMSDRVGTGRRLLAMLAALAGIPLFYLKKRLRARRLRR